MVLLVRDEGAGACDFDGDAATELVSLFSSGALHGGARLSINDIVKSHIDAMTLRPSPPCPPADFCSSVHQRPPGHENCREDPASVEQDLPYQGITELAS